MKNQALQEQLFRTMFRLRRFYPGDIFEDISMGEFKVLEILSGCSKGGNAGQGIYVSKMASMMEVSSPAVSRMLKSMEARDYIGRHVDSKDRRNTCVFITETGIKKRDECRKLAEDFMDRVINRVKPENVQRMLDLFHQMLDVMEDELKKTEKGDKKC